MTDGQKPVTTIRFPLTMIANARRLADRDGKSLSAWIRLLAEREIGRRTGTCPACGQPVETP